jgi:F-type H+-transporting ATPase subunit b
MISFITLAVTEAATDGGPVKQIAETFGVTWWYFLCQCISFSLVAFLLNKFAYKPILQILEERRQKIAQGLENAQKIKEQLAEAQKSAAQVIERANAEARAAAKALQERESQAAVAQAAQIIAKAREATEVEREQAFAELKREVTRLVIDTTSKVTGKVLTTEDQRRLSEEAKRELAA